MRYAGYIVCLVLAGFLSCEAASAGSYQEKLSECLVEKSSKKDKETLVEWSVLVYSNHPIVKKYFNVSNSDRNNANKKAGELFQRLIVVDCAAEIKKAVKYEGRGVIEYAFQTFGNIAGKELAKDPKVMMELSEFTRYIDQKKLQGAFE